MKTIHIDLNQLQDLSAVKRQTVQLLFSYIVASLTILILSGVVFFQYSKLRGKAGALQKASNRFTTQINQIQQSADYISENEVRDLKHLNSNRMFWTKKLEALANLTANNIALTSVKYDSNTLYISGIAKIQKGKNQFRVISHFIEQIKSSPDFQQDFAKFNFVSSKRSVYGGRSYIQFEVSGHAKP